MKRSRSRSRRLAALTVALLTAVPLMSPASAATGRPAPPPTPTVEVGVRWNQVERQLTGQEYGLNAFQGFDPAVGANPAYQAGLEYMAPGLIRFHSWEMMRDSGAADGRNGWLDTANQTWDAAKVLAALDAFGTQRADILMNIPGFPSWLDTDQDGFLDPGQAGAYAQFCAELVRIVNVEGGFGVRFWEPTNERDDNYYVQPTGAGSPDRLDELTDIYVQAARAMKSVDPSIQTGGLAFARPDLLPQVERFVAATAKIANPVVLDFLSYHFYANGDLSESNKTVYDRVFDPADPTSGSLATHTRDLRELLDAVSPNRRVPLWLDEYNISWTCTNNDPRMHDNRGAAFDVLAMIYATRNGADATAAWNDFDGVYGKLGENLGLRPGAHAFQLLNTYAGGAAVTTTSSDESKVVTYATRRADDGSRTLVMVNRTSDVQQVRPRWNGNQGAAAVQRHQISTAGYTIGSTSWQAVTRQGLTLPADSVTVVSDRPVAPKILPVVDGATTPPGAPAEPADPSAPEGALLRGSVSGSAGVNLSDEGSADWAQWGTFPAAPTDVVRSAAGGSTISPLVIIGSPQYLRGYTTDWWSPAPASWTGGAPLTTADGSPAAAVLGGPAGTGFSFTVPAGTDARTLRVHLGVMGSKGILRAFLSDGSSAEYTTSADDSAPDVINNSGGAASKVVSLTYRAASAGQTLTVEYVMNYSHWGNAIWLQAATLAPADVTAPTAPPALALWSADSVSAAVTWDASTDSTGVTAYDVYRDGALVQSISGSVSSLVVTGLRPGISAQITVLARDAAGNTSAASAPLVVTGRPDRQPPTEPLSPRQEQQDGSVRLTWGPAFDDAGPVTYEVSRAGRLLASTTSRELVDTSGRNGLFAVVAVDGAGNRSAAASSGAAASSAS